MQIISNRLRVTRLRCEHQAEPAGLNRMRPRFDWALEGKAASQKAWRLMISTNSQNLETGIKLFWDSGRRESSDRFCYWSGPPLPCNACLWWTIQVWDDEDQVTDLATPARLFTGLPHDEWQARWIGRYFVDPMGRAVPQDDLYDNQFQARPADYLRRDVFFEFEPVEAIAYVSALGLYEFYINGQRISHDEMAPSWTDYHIRCEYRTYDVAQYLKAGANCLAAIIGEGWYCGRIGHNQRRAGNHYGGRPAFICQIHLRFSNGTEAQITSDHHWQTTRGPILYSDFLAGESYDARRALGDWTSPGFVSDDWQPVETFVPEPMSPRLEAARCQPTRQVTKIAALQIGKVGEEFIFNTGQNLAGYVEMVVKAEKGTCFNIRHAERLKQDGSLYVDNLRYAVSKDIYVVGSGQIETFRPHFTFHGFQYIGVTIDGPGTIISLSAVALQTDMPVTGHLETANKKLNQLISNIFWGQRSNFLSVPTDCPQRDERYGWTADAQVFWRTAGFNMDVAAFLNKWMVDLIDGQSAEGAFPDVAPTKPLNPYRLTPQPGAPAWGDAPIILAWHHWLRYADYDLLEQYFPAFVAWMEYIERSNPDDIRTQNVHNNYGDWLNIDQATDPALVASAYWIHLVDLMGNIAQVIGRSPERWKRLATRLRTAFARHFGPDMEGNLSSSTQTAYLLALAFRLVSVNHKPALVSKLVQAFEKTAWHLATGFIGVRHVCPVIADYLSHERAVDLLLQEDYPSWLFSVHHGATTIWERWDGWSSDRGFQSPAMNSFNHYSFGAIGEWIWSRLAGIDWNEKDPGFNTLNMRPIFDTRIGRVSATYDASHGTIKSEWQIADDRTLVWNISLPPGTKAKVILPDYLKKPRCDGQKVASMFELGAGKHSFSGLLEVLSNGK